MPLNSKVPANPSGVEKHPPNRYAGVSKVMLEYEIRIQ